MRFLAILGACTCLLGIALPSQADDAETTPPTVYESLADIAVGTLFFSPSERRQMDVQRAGIAVPGKKAGKARAAVRDHKDAAGFIVSSNGESRVFREGDFRKEQPNPKMQFPGDVKIIRKAESDDEDD